jgi:hypothetical protein
MKLMKDGWIRFGGCGRVMYSKGPLRIQKSRKRWRLWDVLKIPEIRPLFNTTAPTLRDAKRIADRMLSAGYPP